MTKKHKESSHKYNQPSLFDYVKEITRCEQGSTPKGSLDIETEFKEALADDIRHATDERGLELSRFQVAARMSDHLGCEITKSMIDNWTATSHPHSIPASYLPAFTRATGGQRRHAEVISRHSGLFLLPGPEALRAEIQRLDEEEKRIKTEKQKRRFYLRELEGK